MPRAIIMASLACIASAGCGADCDPEDIDGTYTATSTELSGGTCGSLGTFVIQYDHGSQTTASGCTIDYERLSDDQCTAERAVTCTNTADDIEAKGVGAVTQKPGGESITGTISLTQKRISTGATMCQSTYSLTYARQ